MMMMLHASIQHQVSGSSLIERHCVDPRWGLVVDRCLTKVMVAVVVVVKTRRQAMHELVRLTRHCVEPWLGCCGDAMMDRCLPAVVVVVVVVKTRR